MKLFHREYGQGAAVVLLHGLLGSSDNWHTVAGMLADRYRVIVPDMRNHGRSPHSDSHTYAALSEDVLEMVHELGLERPVLVGHSMGGKVAMELALSHPEVPRAVVVEDMIPGETSPISGPYIHTLLELDLSSGRKRKDFEERLIEQIGDRTLALFLLKNIGRDANGTFSWKCNLDALDANYDELWKELEGGRTWEGPALIIRGGRSDIVADDRFGEIFSYFPKALIATVDHAGHWVHGDALTEFLIHLQHFLTSLKSRQDDYGLSY